MTSSLAASGMGGHGKLFLEILPGDWEPSDLRLQGIAIINETNAAVFFGRTLPSRFLNQDAIDELRVLRITSSGILQDEFDNPKRSEDLRRFLKLVYVCLHMEGRSMGIAAEMCKSLLRFIGFLKIRGVFICGPVVLEAPLGNGKIKIDAVVKSKRGRILLVIRGEKDFDIQETYTEESCLVADLVAAFNHNVEAGFEHGDIFGITVKGTMLTFYRLNMTREVLQKLRQCNKVSRDERVLEVKKYNIADYPSLIFMILAEDGMYKTLQCVEAIRLFVQENVAT